MRVYAGSDIRNIAVTGHAQCGKTSLISAFLYASKMTPALGRVADGSAVTAYDEEDVARQMTLSNAVAYAEWNGVKINFIDTPGFHMFAHEARAAMTPVETALIVLNAANGVEPMTDRVWKYASEAGLPRVIVVNQVDNPKADHANRQQMIEDLQQRWGREVTPVELPIVDAQGFRGVVDLIAMKAYTYELDGAGRGEAGAIPAALEADAKAAHEALVEMVAEGKDELMEEFFANGTIAEDHLIAALGEAVRGGRIFPVLYTSGARNVGVDRVLDFAQVYAPSPLQRAPWAMRSAGGGQEAVTRASSEKEPLALFVYKTMSDPFAGRISFFKVLSGVAKNDAAVENYTRHESERLSHLSVAQGRKSVEAPELHVGDLGAVPKLRSTLTGDTLGDKASPALLEQPAMPDPAMTYAIEPKSRGDEDKLAPALHKVMEEDQMVRFFRDPQTNEFLVSGSGQQHIEAVVSKLKRRYHTEVTLKAPKVPYRETIRGKAEAQGRHKKQSGGHGQFGDCKIRMEPMPRGGGFEFVNDIFGGAIPRQYVPAVEKGIVESAARGFLAGYPVVDFRATVFDGSYHDVDSSEMAFKIAGRLAFRKCMEQAKPALLEPVMRVEIEAPDEFAGALIADLNGRRGRIQGMDSAGTGTTVRAEVPMAEMLTYGATLTSMTQGRGSFRMEMDHYDVVPQLIAEKILATAKRPIEEDEE